MPQIKKFLLIILCIIILLSPSFSTHTAKASSLAFVILSQYSANVDIGEEFYLIAVASDLTLPTWKSSNSSIASVNTYGKVTAKKSGTVTITAKIKHGEASCRVTVNKTRVTLSNTIASIERGETLTLTAVTSNHSPVIWKSSKKSIATIDEKGVVTGLKPGETTITATADKSSVTCKLTVRLTAYALPPVVTTSTRTGLSGVVGDTAYNVIADAEITVLATDRHTRSDSTGAFYLPVKPGRHVVRVSRPGYAPRMVSVTIPTDSGRRIVVWLTPSDRRGAGRELLVMDSLNDRLIKMNPVWSKIYTREDIVRTGITEISQLATVGAGKRVDERCSAIIDGGPHRAPIWTFSPADLEMMEIYTAPPPRETIAKQTARIFGRGGPDRRGTAPATMPDADCGAAIYVWLRK
jgi:hypothetical protein